MKRDYLPVEALVAWARFNGVSIDGIAFQRLQSEDGTDKGSAIVSTKERFNDDGASESTRPEVPLKVPSDLILSLESVDTYAKSDRYLREVLEAVGDFGRTARGAILIFLLIQITYSSPDFVNEDQRVGVGNPWTEYIKFMPASIPLPTFYTSEERELLRGTSLKSALDAKTSSLEREFEHLRQCTDGIPWCHRYWWDEQSGKLSFDDWKYVDAAYRSRTVDLPGSGHSMVPCIDMANHASDDTVNALYETDAAGDAVLQLRWGRKLDTGEEVTISYGNEKPAAEMVFSYGFLETGRANAGQMLLSVDIPDDDPLKLAKKAFCKDAAGVRLISTSSEAATTDWENSILWWACVNEEDGLDFDVLQTTDGKKELRAVWKGEEIANSAHLKSLLAADPLWDIFQLRAVVIVLERLELQLSELQGIEEVITDVSRDESMLSAIFRPEIFGVISKLRVLEADLLKKGIEDLMTKKNNLLTSGSVAAYLEQQAGDVEEDFS